MTRRNRAGMLNVGAVVMLMALAVAWSPLAQAQDEGRPNDELGPAEASIVGGVPVDQGEYPFLAAVVLRNQPDMFVGQICGGSVISSRWILTAAHCFFDPATGLQVRDAGSIDVVTGRINIDCIDRNGSCGQGQRIAITNVVLHPDFVPASAANDLALLELAVPTSAPPVSVANPNQAALFSPGTVATLIGWGSVNQDLTNLAFPFVAREVNLPLISDAACQGPQSRWSPADIVDDVMLCAGLIDGGTGPCLGDSGGPLLVPDGVGGWLQVGIASFVSRDGCAVPFYPSVHTEVAAFFSKPDFSQPIRFCDGRVVTINMNLNGELGNGTTGADVILGTPGDDLIRGFGGDDTICSGAGRDFVYGGDGVDTIFGGSEIDRIWGNGGDDVIHGEGGSDRIRAGSGRDTVFAGSGADRVWGGPGNDTLRGMGGQDFMWGEAGNDVMQGNFQSDWLYGGPGNDEIYGAGGKDKLFGETGNDDMYGGANTDYLFGGVGVDVANGGRGRDNPLVTNVSGCVAETRNSC